MNKKPRPATVMRGVVLIALAAPFLVAGAIGVAGLTVLEPLRQPAIAWTLLVIGGALELVGMSVLRKALQRSDPAVGGTNSSNQK